MLLAFALIAVSLLPRQLHALQTSQAVLQEYANFAEELAHVAGKAIMPYWRRPINVETKEEEGRSLAQTLSPVTAADRAAEQAMRQLIETRYPTHGIYGEEFGSVRVDNAEFVWVLDPIDGTKSFITGKPTWGILVACLCRGVPVVGVIDQCVLKERWVGVQGRPTTLNGQPVSVDASVTSLDDATVYTTTPDMFRRGQEIEKFETIRNKSLRTLYGCDCYAYGLVASGFGADAVVEADLGLYDYCAIVPVLEGAGGVISDWRGKRLTLQNHNDSKGRVVACSNEELHSKMLDVLDKRWFVSRIESMVGRAFIFVAGTVVGAIIPRKLL